jgi:hypothetical protein
MPRHFACQHPGVRYETVAVENTPSLQQLWGRGAASANKRQRGDGNQSDDNAVGGRDASGAPAHRA